MTTLPPNIQRMHELLQTNLPYFAETALKIKTKKGTMEPFVFNTAQRYLHSRLEEQKRLIGRVRAYILKGRQQGCSTYVAARFYHRSTRNTGQSVFILSHESETTKKLFRIVERYQTNCPEPLRPIARVATKHEYIFDGIQSDYAIGTAGNENVGRGGTVQLFHGCVAEDSLVVLADGSTKPIKNVEPFDRVMTASGTVASISAKIFTGEKQVFKISTWLSNESIEVSGEHKLLTDKGWQRVEALRGDDWIQLPDMKVTAKINVKRFDLPNKKRKQNGGAVHQETANVTLDYGAGYFFGYYLAEGHVKKQWRSDRHCNVTFCYHENESFIDEVRDFAEKYCTSVQTKHVSLQHKRVTIFNGTFLAEMVRAWFGRVESKGVPEWVFDAPLEFINGILEGYLAGDGSKLDVGRVRAPSIHERISRQLKRLALMVTTGVPGLHYFERERYGVRSKPVLLFALNGRGYDSLKGNEQKVYKNERFKTLDGKRFVKIRAIEQTGVKPTYDIEVDHPDHSFETPIGIISNSEVAFWENPDGIQTGVMQSIPDLPDTEVILESTANGMDPMFYAGCMEAMEGRGEYILIFIPWFWQEEYRRDPPPGFALDDEETKYMALYKLDLAQMYWKRLKESELKGKWKFKQEYPANVQEAFQTSADSYIDSEKVMKARKSTIPDDINAPLIISLDPGRTKDRTVFTWRRGRKILKYESKVYDADDERIQMQIVGRAAQLIDRDQPDAFFMDIGHGHGIYDRLVELGYGDVVTAINFNGTPLNEISFANKRMEMASLFRDWIEREDGEVSIPDDDVLHRDILMIPKPKPTSSGRELLPSKKMIKAKFGVSPDLFDGCILTFAFPVKKADTISQPRTVVKAAERSSTLNTLNRVRAGKHLRRH